MKQKYMSSQTSPVRREENSEAPPKATTTVCHSQARE